MATRKATFVQRVLAMLRKMTQNDNQPAGTNSPPVVRGLERVTGSFPPLGEWDVIGDGERYYLHEAYQSREIAEAYRGWGDSEWQEEVYRYAREVADLRGLSVICDIGCGSGYKLLKHFTGFTIFGLDTPEAVELLRNKYPATTWLPCDFQSLPPVQPDLVIAADVIEHLPRPEALLQYIAAMKPQWVVLSTPDRNLLRMGTHNGPPANACHCREWNMRAFYLFVSDYLSICEHFIVNAGQCTQCVLARPLIHQSKLPSV